MDKFTEANKIEEKIRSGSLLNMMRLSHQHIPLLCWPKMRKCGKEKGKLEVEC